MENFLAHLYSHNIVIKTFHFKTEIYGHHKSCDDYLIKFNDLLDKYMETTQGIKGKIKIQKMDFTLVFPENNRIGEYINTFIDYIKKEKSNTKEGCLINILDDIIQNALQFKYLLSFN